jgi:uncharacterized protein (DUF2236 family)
MKSPFNRDHEDARFGDRGVFAADAMIRRVHRERIVGVLYGPVAVLTMALDPVGFAGFVSGTDDHQPLVGRFIATARTQEAIILGTEDQAREAIDRVKHLHSNVRGTLVRQVGDVPAGTPYDANDPDLQLWVIVCLFSAAQAVYERFIRPLTDDERNALWQEYLDLAALLGYPPHLAPRSYSACRQYLQQRIDTARLSDEQRELAINAGLRIPVRRRFRPLLAVVQCTVTGLLPARLRGLYGLRWTPVTAIAFDLLVAATRGLHAVTPERIMHGEIASRIAEYHQRCQHAKRDPAE